MDLARVNSRQHGKLTIQASFVSLFLGGVEELIPLMEKSIPELGLDRKDCKETSWIGSAVFLNAVLVGTSGNEPPEEAMLNRTQIRLGKYKGKSDYVRKPIPVDGLRGVWRLLYDDKIIRLNMLSFNSLLMEAKCMRFRNLNFRSRTDLDTYIIFTMRLFGRRKGRRLKKGT